MPPHPQASEHKGGSSAEATRARILDAAQQAFSARGYKDVGLREIAASAACDPTLIRRYFGSKERLFEQALTRALDIGPLINGPRDNFGERAIALFATDRGNSVQPIPMLIFATSDTISRGIALRLLESQVIGPISAWLGEATAREIAKRITMLCSGYFLYTQILPLAPDGKCIGDTTDQWLANQLQQVIDHAG